MTRVRIDRVALETRSTVDPADLDSDVIFHYSIPTFDATGDGAYENALEIGSSKTRLRGGEVLISKLNPRKQRILRAAPHDVPTVCSGEFVVLQPRGIHPRYLEYFLGTETTRQYLDARVQSVTRSQQRVRPEDITKMWFGLPPLSVQRSIAAYLDRETTRIDALIGAKQRMVELLGEQVHSYTDQAVRGCAQSSSDAQSSVIGTVPASWDVVRVRRVASIFSGTTFPHDYQGRPDGDYPLYKVADLSLPGNETHLKACENWVSTDDLRRLRGRIVPPDSVVFPRVGAALLLNARRITTRPSLVDDNSRALQFSSGDARFWRCVMTLVDFGELANPGAVPTIGEEAILSMKIPAPPDQTQRTIADAIDAFRDRCDQLRAGSDRQIALLQERRRALITAAVAGQVDVPEAA